MSLQALSENSITDARLTIDFSNVENVASFNGKARVTLPVYYWVIDI